jgi:hypothetical protein
MTAERDKENFVAAASKLREAVNRERASGPASLDDLIELLDADDLRNVVGMLRPKGRPGVETERFKA